MGGEGGGEPWRWQPERQTLTLVHAVQDQVELLLRVLAVMLLPALPSLTPQDHQLPLLPPQGSKVGDLHDHRAGGGGREETVSATSKPGGTRLGNNRPTSALKLI